MYIGGGEIEGGNYKVLEYTIQGDQWREIVSLVQYFGMTIANNQLIIIGGRECGPTKKVWVLDSVSGTWTQPFNAMPTPRSWPSAVGYKRWVLVVGGVSTRCVEVLDTASNKWYVATPLPCDAKQPSLTVIQDTLHIVGILCCQYIYSSAHIKCHVPKPNQLHQ